MQQVQLGPVAYSGFPVRSLTKQLNGNGGEWVTAYRVEQKKRFTTKLSHALPEATSSRVIRPPTNTREVSGSIASRVPLLNKSFLLSHCYVNEPNDLSVANISGSGLYNYSPDDLTLFSNVIHVNASDNKLAVETFVCFPSLEGLELSLNGVVDIQLNPGDFTCLNSLDLSYNTLSGLALMDLGKLPSLSELHLTGNNIVALPVEMSRPFQNRDGGFNVRFPVLERLWLDDNKLSDQTTFATLAGLRKLKYLNLDNNEIYMLPQLKLLGSSPLKQSHSRGVSDFSSLTSTHLIQSQSPNTNTSNSQQHSSRLHQVLDAEKEEPRSDNSTPMLPSIHVPPNTAERASPLSKSEIMITTHSVIDLPKSKSSVDTSFKQEENNYSETSKLERPSNPLLHSQKAEQPPISSTADIQNEPSRNQAPVDDNKQLPSSQTDSVPVPLNAFTESSQPEGNLQTSSQTQEESDTYPVGSLNSSSKVDLSSDGTQGPVDYSRMPQYSPSDMMSVAPFPELETLSLVNNLILAPDGVIACETWPALKKLVIFNNPFTSTSKGMPPLLQVQLVNQQGIKVIRKKPVSSQKYHIGSGAKEFKKVSSQPPPPIPKCPLPAIEAPPSMDLKMIGYTPSLTGTHSSNRSFSPDSNSSLGSILDDSEDTDQQGVFMTQVTGDDLGQDPSPQSPSGVRDSTWSAKDDYEVRRRDLKEKYKDVPERYKGYEVLLDTFNDPQTKIPSDIHSCVRALQYSLKHPLVLGDGGPVASSIASSSSSTVSTLTGNYLKKKTPSMDALPPVKTHGKVREIQGVLDDIRTHCTTLETNLSLALRPKTPPEKKSISQLQKESKQLLVEMQACYDRVRASSLRSVQSVSAEVNPLGAGRKSGTPKTPRVRFSRDNHVHTDSPRHSRESRSSSRARGSGEH